MTTRTLLTGIAMALLLAGCGEVTPAGVAVTETDAGDDAGTVANAGAGGGAGGVDAGAPGGAGGAGSGGSAAAGGSGGAPGCAAGATSCGSTCAYLATDNDNCGACGHACPASAACVDGACACPRAGWHICSRTVGGVYDPPHCVDTSTDTSYCGSCSTLCGVSQACVAGACQ